MNSFKHFATYHFIVYLSINFKRLFALSRISFFKIALIDVIPNFFTYCYFVFFIGISFCANAQQPTYFNYTVKEGLPSNTIYSSFLDRKGYMWFGTDRGLVKYDGYVFTIFTTADGLPGNVIYDIFEDSKGRIWLACNNGEACFIYKNNFYTKKNEPTLNKIVANGSSLKTLEDKDHNIILLMQFNIIKITPTNDVQQLHKTQVKYYSGMSLNDKNEIVVLANTGMYNINTGISVEFDSYSKNKPLGHSKTMIFNNKLYHTQSTELACNNLPGDELSTETYKISDATSLTQSLVVDRSNNILIGTQNGLYQWDMQKKKILSRSFDKTSISSLLIDKEGNLWITSLNNGIFLSINPNIKLLNSKSGLTFNYSNFVDRLSDGTIAIGSNQYKLAFLRDSQIHNIKLPEQFGEGKVEKIRVGMDGNYYVALGSILMKVNRNNFAVKILTMAARDILFKDKNKILVVAGTSLLEMNTNNPEQIPKLSKKPIQKSDGIIIENIIASGIYRGSFSNRHYLYGLMGIKYFENDSLKDLLPNNDFLSKNIYRVQETPDGLVWMASNIYGVLVLYKNQLFTLDKSAGLPSNFINSIYVDAQNQIWVGSVEGLSKITYTLWNGDFKFQVLNYFQSDGLIAKNINDITKDGETIYATTEEGVCVFKESDLKARIKEPLLNIESIYFNDQLQVPSNHYKSTYNKNSIKIKYVGLSYGSLGKIQYKYRIKGLENNWTYTNNTVLDYPGMPPGDYTFELVSFNSKGIFSETKSFQITISPPFWRTWWFIILIGILSILLAYLYLQRRLANIKKSHQTKEQLLNLENQNLEAQKKQAVYERELLDIKNQALRLHMNPHFIFNAINSIQGFYASGEIEIARSYIGKFSTLLRMILDQSKKEFIDIQDEIKTITNYLELNKLRFDNKFTFEIIVDPSLLSNNEEVAPMLIQPFIENAILHGIAPLLNTGKIIVRILDHGNYIRCEIEDNGVGRTFSYQMNKDRVYNSTGIQVTQKRIDLLNGNLHDRQMEPINIIDLMDEEGKPIGTKVVFNVLKNSI